MLKNDPVEFEPTLGVLWQPLHMSRSLCVRSLKSDWPRATACRAALPRPTALAHALNTVKGSAVMEAGSKRLLM